ncbi:hypothetical protein AYI68_g4445 [Smittium mucronatum]|uniref:Uncharacterized protein n=1 Tax=Smittium mucronatum TaxID=133383 RepID=A0A1R0GX32_9FUNG|nr:hypothetical protein AYI68_g4445 [Smittium mucronatum]
MVKSTNEKTPLPSIASSGYMTEVACSQELRSFSTNYCSLKLLSPYSEPTPNRINKIGLLHKRGIDQHGFPTNSC